MRGARDRPSHHPHGEPSMRMRRETRVIRACRSYAAVGESPGDRRTSRGRRGWARCAKVGLMGDRMLSGIISRTSCANARRTPPHNTSARAFKRPQARHSAQPNATRATDGSDTDDKPR
ncbi:hypothetical protein CAOG_010145 [Capsaspora owczarzaki ATCC 30864]|uniref:Uncharacterized protein n=1 Tax=Capsaspora owczarzaki (strain ATCC 30864) TaxID=595528 RepID=A0A0D2W0D1_CAPO3|nr:hypothetical protein CAOG_010145 [Capsaspora owczarzaki ATCC 30864]